MTLLRHIGARENAGEMAVDVISNVLSSWVNDKNLRIVLVGVPALTAENALALVYEHWHHSRLRSVFSSDLDNGEAKHVNVAIHRRSAEGSLSFDLVAFLAQARAEAA